MEKLHLDAPARILFDLLRPGNQGLGRNRRLRWQHLMQPQGHLLRQGRT